jgi:hypothetical protein
MNGMFRNSRGFRDLAKHSHIADSCKDYNLDFVAISETGKHDYSQSLLNRLSGGSDFQWFSRSSRGRFGGIFVGVRSDTMDILASSDGSTILNSLFETWLIFHLESSRRLWSSPRCV